MQPPNVLTEWANLLFASLASAGITDVVVSPGSRSTPFLIAAVRETKLTCHSIIDERAAAFFALGQARVTGRPSVLLCTSGSAVAHYLPAIIEAAASFIPLIVLTADRPTELQDCAAPQTIDQVKIFGGQVRHFFDLGMPDASVDALRAVRRMCAQAAFASVWPTPGAIHINARARKPLEPREPDSAESHEMRARARAIAASPVATPRSPVSVPNVEAIRDVAALCRGAERGLILCGPAPASQARDRDAIFSLASATGFPIVCEATSQLRFASAPTDVVVLDAFDPLYRSAAFRERADPDLVIHIGTPVVSSGWDRTMSTSRATHVALSEHGWNDPHSSISHFIFAEPCASARALAGAVGETKSAARDAWRHFIARANAAAWSIIDDDLAHARDDLTEGEITRAIVSKLPSDHLLVVGNSLPVRHLDTFCKQGSSLATVLCQRGASGIDGLLAGALGAANKWARPVTLLLGDVSLLHDLTSLQLARQLETPLVVAVIQNYGGRIFEQLPLARVTNLEPDVMRLTTTPHSIDLSHAARLFGVGWERATREDELRAALDRASPRVGCTLVEAIVGARSSAAQSQDVWRAIDEKIARDFPAK